MMANVARGLLVALSAIFFFAAMVSAGSGCERRAQRTAPVRVAPRDLTALGLGAGDAFGTVAVSGNTAIVGALGDDEVAPDAGAAYLFDVTTGNQLAKLGASDAQADDWFGMAVDIDANVGAVGAPRHDDRGLDCSGAVYLFNVPSGEQIAKLTPTDAEEADAFGMAVAIDGNHVVVGARFDDDAGSESGATYLFDARTGEQIAKLTASDAREDEHFGVSVAIDGDTILVGALSNKGGNRAGAVYVFDAKTGREIGKLPGAYNMRHQFFGYALALSGSTAVVGAWGERLAYVFDLKSRRLLAALKPPDARADDWFGAAVATDGQTVVVGADHDDHAGEASGAAYLFDAETGDLLAKLVASNPTRGERFGMFVDISGKTVVVGTRESNRHGEESGAVYVFDLSERPRRAGY